MEQIAEIPVARQTLPSVINFQKAMEMPALIEWYHEHKGMIDRELLTSGAVLLQGAEIDSVEKFEAFSGTISSKFRDYVDGNYPRRNLKGHVYISTEYDPKYDITMHNELSYSFKWPSRLMLGCVIPPEEGGETPLADSRQILKIMNPDLVRELEERKIRYIRNLHSGSGMGPSWQETFATDDKQTVEAYCRQIDMKFFWKDNDDLRLESIRPAVRQHPVTKERVWFNQIDQYHPSHFPTEVYETLLMLAGENEEDLPLYVSFGDGGAISEDIIREVIHTINRVVVVRPWQKGDFVIVDNMLVAHGRKAYKGNRKIVVAMAE